jgi:hypothetical protein
VGLTAINSAKGVGMEGSFHRQFFLSKKRGPIAKISGATPGRLSEACPVNAGAALPRAAMTGPNPILLLAEAGHGGVVGFHCNNNLQQPTGTL